MRWRRSRSWRTAGLCSPGPMQYAVTAALTGDRSHQVDVQQGARSARDADGAIAERDPGHALRDAARRVLRDAAVTLPPGAPTKTTCWPAARDAACSASTAPASAWPADGFFRIVFLASLDGSREIYDDIAAFTAEYFRAAGFTPGLIVPPPASATPESPRRLILWTIAMVVLTGLLLWAAWEVRDVLLLIYVSALLAIGFSPIVRIIERQKVIPIGTRRLPRWLAILLLYLIFVGVARRICLTIVPPLVRQAQDLATALPGMIEKRAGFPDPARRHRSPHHAARGGDAGPAAGPERRLRHGVLGGRQHPRRALRVPHDPDPDVLPAGRLRQPARRVPAAVPARPPHARRRPPAAR